MRKSFVLAATVAAALALAGCSGGIGTATAPAITNAAQLADAMTAATQGKNSATMKMNISAEGQTFTGDGAYAINGTDVKMKLNFTVPGQGALEMRLLDKVIYVKIPESTGQSGWVKVPVDANNPQTAQFAQLIDQVDVSKQFDQFKAAGTLTGQSPDTIDGTPTTRYDLTVDVDKAVAAAANDAAREQLKPLQTAGVKTLNTQVWVDSANLPRQVKTSFTAQGKPADATITLSQWGAPVDVQAPPADQVQEIPAN